MSNSMERYQKLEFKEGLSRIHHYPSACKDLSLILREAYNKIPKNLQSVVVQDTLFAFRLLTEMQTSGAVSAAHVLLQSAEAVLPKQKKNLAVKEFKNAVVAHKRRLKARRDEQSTTDLPHDVLLHIFSFLDMKSLVSAESVCWSWNLAATNDQLWESQYAIFFGNKLKTRELTHLQDDTVAGAGIESKEAFKRAYLGNSSKRLTSNRGFCSQCDTIVWLDNMKCCNRDHEADSDNQQIVPVSPHQVIDYLLNGSSILYSSDSESESEEELLCSLWAYPRHFAKYGV
ncbi:F-box protein At5g52880 isoform X2 [Mercurialis annua]|uniref:F-box protein At5g52880 isoform X2 n=1 Tax=Mercurialis annua TaxID=3986 RepID=UPI00215FD6DD|nr:F-box protein At5g52880 isoform X2 [Mercurialis annua]